MDPKSSSSPALTHARLNHLYTAAFSLSGHATSSAAFLGDEALSLSCSASTPATQNTQAPINVLAQALASASPHRRLVGHVEFCNRCGLCLLSGTTARRVVKWTISQEQRHEKVSTARKHVPRPSKRRKIEWGPRKTTSKTIVIAEATPPSVSRTVLPAHSETPKMAKSQKSFAIARKPTVKRVKSVDLHCVKCGGSTRLGFARSVAAAAKPALKAHPPALKPVSKTGEPLPAVAAIGSAAPSSKNGKSKQRAKARKQGGLAAEVERDKGTAQDTGGRLGFDLMDFMKG